MLSRPCLHKFWTQDGLLYTAAAPTALMGPGRAQGIGQVEAHLKKPCSPQLVLQLFLMSQ